MHDLWRACAHNFNILTTVYLERIDAPGGILSSLLSTTVMQEETPYHKVNWVYKTVGTCSRTTRCSV